MYQSSIIYNYIVNFPLEDSPLCSGGDLFIHNVLVRYKYFIKVINKQYQYLQKHVITNISVRHILNHCHLISEQASHTFNLGTTK